MIFHTTSNSSFRWIGSSIALLTLFALLNVMAIPLICGLGGCTPDEQADCCGKCESQEQESETSNSPDCEETVCPFASSGACSGFVYLHETDLLPEVVLSVELIAQDFPASYPVGFTFDLIRPPTASC